MFFFICSYFVIKDSYSFSVNFLYANINVLKPFMEKFFKYSFVFINKLLLIFFDNNCSIIESAPFIYCIISLEGVLQITLILFLSLEYSNICNILYSKILSFISIDILLSKDLSKKI